jgi:YQGE family putative transporter
MHIIKRTNINCEEEIMCKEAKILLVLSALFTFAMGLSGIFINIFFWKQTSNFMVITLYNLTHYLVTPITFFIAGVLAKRKNGIWSLRAGLLLFAIFFGLILYSGNRGVPYIYFLGILFGMASGFYWLAFNTLTFDFTSVNNRDTFNGIQGSCCGVAGAVAPITSGFIISRFKGGYNIVFSITLGIFVILVLISLILKCKNYGSRLNIKKAIGRNCEDWDKIRKATMIWGFRDVIIGFLISILIIETTKSELSLGTFSLIGSLVSSASFMLVQKIIKPSHRRLSIFLGAIGSFIAVLGLVFMVSYKTLIMYTLLDTIFIPFFIIQLSSSTFNVINRSHDEDMRIEYMINKDLMLNGGRIISSLVLITMLTVFKNTSVLKFYLLFIGFAPLASGFFLSKLRRVLEGK